MEDRTANAKEGFVGEYGSPLFHRVDVDGEAQVAQVGEKVELEEGFACGIFEALQVVEVVLVHLEVLDVFENDIDARGDGIAPIEGVFAEEEVEDRFAIGHLVFPIAVGHGQFIEVCQQTQRVGVDLLEKRSSHVFLGSLVFETGADRSVLQSFGEFLSLLQSGPMHDGRQYSYYFGIASASRHSFFC